MALRIGGWICWRVDPLGLAACGKKVLAWASGASTEEGRSEAVWTNLYQIVSSASIQSTRALGRLIGYIRPINGGEAPCGHTVSRNSHAERTTDPLFAIDGTVASEAVNWCARVSKFPIYSFSCTIACVNKNRQVLWSAFSGCTARTVVIDLAIVHVIPWHATAIGTGPFLTVPLVRTSNCPIHSAELAQSKDLIVNGWTRKISCCVCWGYSAVRSRDSDLERGRLDRDSTWARLTSHGVRGIRTSVSRIEVDLVSREGMPCRDVAVRV